MDFTVTLNFTKETKNTVRYDADSDDAAIQAVYIIKAQVKDKPKVITLNVVSEKSKK